MTANAELAVDNKPSDNCLKQELNLTTPSLELKNVDEAPRTNSQRELTVSNWWSQQCPEFERQAVRRYRQHNLICRIPGKSEQTLVVGAHYDKVSEGYGVADNWSGIVMLDYLSRYFATTEPDLTIEFVAFAAEEDGLFGSKAYVDQNTKPITAMINLDTIGLGSLVVDGGSDSVLMCQAECIAEQLGYPITVQTWREVSSDWERFAKKGIPAIGIHSVTKRTVRRIHHRRDKAGNVDLDRLHEALKLAKNLIDQNVH